jgi:monoamine oxidase
MDLHLLRFFGPIVASLVFFSAEAAKIPKTTDVVVIGAGLSGMATAYGLQKAGITYHVLEIAPRVGGRVRTVGYERAGMPEIRTDSGMEEYWASNPAVKILKELKLPVSEDVAISSIVLDKKLFALGDESAVEFYSKVFSPPELTALKAFKTKVAPIISSLHPEKKLADDLMKLKEISFAEYIQKENLPKKVSDWIRISLECEIGTSWERISALDGLAEFHIFLGEEGEKCYRVKGGNDRFTDAFAKAIGVNHISTNKRVTRIVSKGDSVFINYLDLETNKNGVVEAKHVVSTIPLFRLFEVQFEPPLSESKQSAIHSMTWGSYFKVHLFLNKNAQRFWTKEKSSALPILSDSDLGVIYDGNPAGLGDVTILSLLTYGDAAEKFNLMPLDKVRAQILAEFEKMWPGFSKEVRDVEFYRYHPRAIAAWPVGRSRFDEISNEIRKSENHVHLAGDFTESSHSDGAFISAERAVRQILEEHRGLGMVQKHSKSPL